MSITFIGAGVWMLVAMVIAVRQALDYQSTWRAIGVVVIGFLRFYEDFDPNTKYSPAKYEDGKLKPAENK